MGSRAVCLGGVSAGTCMACIMLDRLEEAGSLIPGSATQTEGAGDGSISADRVLSDEGLGNCSARARVRTVLDQALHGRVCRDPSATHRGRPRAIGRLTRESVSGAPDSGMAADTPAAARDSAGALVVRGAGPSARTSDRPANLAFGPQAVKEESNRRLESCVLEARSDTGSLTWRAATEEWDLPDASPAYVGPLQHRRQRVVASLGVGVRIEGRSLEGFLEQVRKLVAGLMGAGLDRTTRLGSVLGWRTGGNRIEPCHPPNPAELVLLAQFGWSARGVVLQGRSVVTALRPPTPDG